MRKPATLKRLVSSGGVIFRGKGKAAQVALIAVKNMTVWCLPKGIIDKKEDSRSAAIREVREETGLSGELLEEIGKISYWYFIKDENSKIHKTVHFFLLAYIEGSTDRHDSEVDDARWFSIEEALEKLSYSGEREILKRAEKMISKFGVKS